MRKHWRDWTDADIAAEREEIAKEARIVDVLFWVYVALVAAGFVGLGIVMWLQGPSS